MSRQLTAAQVADRIGCSTATLATWRCLGKGPRFIKYGEERQSRVRYPEDEVDAWQAAHRVLRNTAEADPVYACQSPQRHPA